MSGSANQFTDSFAKKKARENDCTILYGDANTLLLDIDDDESLKVFEEMFAIAIEQNLPFEERITWLRSKSGNRHILVHLTEPLPLDRRIALQAALGSDRKRELLSLIGSKNGQENPVLLFRPKKKGERKTA